MAVYTAMRNRLRPRQMLKIKGISDKISIPNTLQRFLSTYTTKPFGYKPENITNFFVLLSTRLLRLAATKTQPQLP